MLQGREDRQGGAVRGFPMTQAAHISRTGVVEFFLMQHLEAALDRRGDESWGLLLGQTTKQVVLGLTRQTGKNYLFTPARFNRADGIEFRPGQDFIEHPISGGAISTSWATAGPGGGFVIEGQGSVSWPSLGIFRALPEYAVDALTHWAPGALADGKRAGVGIYSPSAGMVLAAIAYYSGLLSRWFKSDAFGSILAPAYSSVIGPNVYEIDEPNGLSLALMAAGAKASSDTGAYLASAIREDLADVPSTSPFTQAGVSAALFTRSDLRPIIYIDDEAAGDMAVRIETLNLTSHQ